MQPLCAAATALAVVLLAVAVLSDRSFDLAGCHHLHGSEAHNGTKTRLGGLAANPAECGQLCSSLGYRYFALMPEHSNNKSLCWCVRRRHAFRGGRHRLGRSRDMRFQCRNPDDAFLFRMTHSFGSLGCYAFNATSASAWRRPRMSPGLCRRHCRRHPSFALASGRLCRCIGARLLESLGQRQRESGCSRRCPGDSGHLCGSDADHRLMSVYRVRR